MRINLIIAAGGLSQRYGVKNKLFEPCGSSSVIIEAIKPFLSFEEITKIIIGVDPSYSDELLEELDKYSLMSPKITLCVGGRERTDTVRNALISVEDEAEYIMVHDGARPYVSSSLIQKVIAKMAEADAALPLLSPTDSLVLVDGITPVDRKLYRCVQTPLICRANIFKKAYQNAKTAFYDDISVIKTLDNVNIAYVDGEPSNIKITYSTDIVHALRTGVGYDIHRMQKGEGITLCGVHIPCKYSLVAHSDGDVPVHAVMDAILTALADKDIGHHFPVDDPRYDGISSMVLLDKVLHIAYEKGFKVGNVSIAIIAQRPMLYPYIDEMRGRIAAALNIPAECVGISATTNEKVGELGKAHAIAAYASVLLSDI